MNQTDLNIPLCPVIVNNFDNVNKFVYTYIMNCSEYIENYRKKKNISKADLARKMGIFPQAYNMKLKKDTWTVNQLKQTRKSVVNYDLRGASPHQ